MKKSKLFLLFLGMMLCLTACGSTMEEAADGTVSKGTAKVSDETMAVEGTAEEGKNQKLSDEVEEEPLLGALVSEFKKRMKGKKEMDPGKLARQLLNHPAIKFRGSVTEIMEGPLTGFSGEIDGFAQGVMFAPDESSVPFIGYVFLTEDNAHAEELKRELGKKADPEWNVRAETSRKVIKTVGGMVLFVMYP